VETALKLLPLVDNICVYADSSKDFAVCLVVPNPKHLRALAVKLDLPTDSIDDLCYHAAIEKAVMDIITQQAMQGKSKKKGSYNRSFSPRSIIEHSSPTSESDAAAIIAGVRDIPVDAEGIHFKLGREGYRCIS
jgi:hypothetical protein